MALNPINTMDILQRRRPCRYISPNWCVLCKKNGELVSHLFIHCIFARDIWAYFLGWVNWVWVMPKDVKDLFHQWNGPGFGASGKMFWSCLIHAVLWNIWKERNMRIFEGKLKSKSEVMDMII